MMITAGRYPQLQNPASQIYHYRCKYIFNPSMVYFDVNGRIMPCYSIKEYCQVRFGKAYQTAAASAYCAGMLRRCVR
jgi:hypothetical protein